MRLLLVGDLESCHEGAGICVSLDGRKKAAQGGSTAVDRAAAGTQRNKQRRISHRFSDGLHRVSLSAHRWAGLELEGRGSARQGGHLETGGARAFAGGLY